MAITVTLPNDATATLKDQDDLTNKEVKQLRREARVAAGLATKLKALGFNEDDPETWTVLSELSDEDDDAVDKFQRFCVLTRLVSWTLDRPIPTNADEVDDLPHSIYATIATAAANISFNDQLDVDGATNPKVGTAS